MINTFLLGFCLDFNKVLEKSGETEFLWLRKLKMRNPCQSFEMMCSKID